MLTRVSGIGPAKAKELVDAGIKTLEDLKKHEDKLTNHQKIGLKLVYIFHCASHPKQYIINIQNLHRHFDDFEKKIPREEIEEIESILKECITEMDEDFIVTICGSYRRGKKESGDIDVLLTHPTYTSNVKDKKKHTSLLKAVVEQLREENLITDTISHGEFKFMVRIF